MPAKLEQDFFKWLKSQTGTNREVAKLLGISDQQVQNLRAGDRRPGRLALSGWYELARRERAQ